METIKDKLKDIDLNLEEVKKIYNDYQDNHEIVSLIAMNLSLRTSVKKIKNKQCSKLADILALLATSNNMSTRWSVAKNPCTPIDILTILAHDEINLVRALVATNPSTPQEILISLFNDEKIVRDGLSGNPSTPQKYLHVLSDDSDKMVRLRIASNPSTTKETLEKLLHDKDQNVCIKAREELQHYETKQI